MTKFDIQKFNVIINHRKKHLYINKLGEFYEC